MNQIKVVFPGSFTIFHAGHVDILLRAAKIFSEVCVLVLVNEKKDNLETLDKRLIGVTNRVLPLNLPNVKVYSSKGKLVNKLKDLNTNLIVRGIRNNMDYSYEENLLEEYRKDMPEIEAIYFFSKK